MATCPASAIVIARFLALLLLAAAAGAAEPEESLHEPAQGGQPATLSLTVAQQQAVGIRTEHPLPLAAAPVVEAYGTILDPVAPATDSGRMESPQAAGAAAAADAARQERLYREEAQASLKAWQASQAQEIEAAAQARAARLSFRLQWGPLAHWSASQRRALLEELGAGRQRLLRAHLPGQHMVSAIEPHALLEIDG